jgi:hypothetical protein
VLIAGKGHERVQIIDDQHIPFSDHECVARTLEALAVTPVNGSRPNGSRQGEVAHG